jgi:hypothetical protein
MLGSRRLDIIDDFLNVIPIAVRGHELDAYSQFQGSSVTSLRQIIEDWSLGEGAFLEDVTEKNRTVQLWYWYFVQH